MVKSTVLFFEGESSLDMGRGFRTQATSSKIIWVSLGGADQVGT